MVKLWFVIEQFSRSGVIKTLAAIAGGRQQLHARKPPTVIAPVAIFFYTFRHVVFVHSLVWICSKVGVRFIKYIYETYPKYTYGAANWRGGAAGHHPNPNCKHLKPQTLIFVIAFIHICYYTERNKLPLMQSFPLD